MEHLMNDKLYRLATLLARELGFEADDMAAMQHILCCPACAAKLKRATAIVDSMDNVALVSALAETAHQAQPPQSEQAIIQIVVTDVRAMLQQLEDAAAQWCFDVPLGMVAKRSAGGDGSRLEKLEDLDNTKTFVAYDPDKKTLSIQIDGRDGSVPAARLKMPDGSLRSISFEKRGSVYWAEVHGLEQGAYELILEK